MQAAHKKRFTACLNGKASADGISAPNMMRRAGFVLLLSIMAAGCATTKSPTRTALDQASDQVRENQDDFALVQNLRNQESATENKSEDQSDQLREPVVFKGNDRLYKTPAQREPIKLYGEAVSINFERAPLSDVVHAILGDILELDYVIEHPIEGEVTFRTRTPVPQDQLLQILESLLQANNAVMVRDADDRLFVSASGRVTQMLPSVSNPNSKGAGYSINVIPLQYISANVMADILRPLAPEEAFVRVDNARNLLMMAGTRNQVDGWMDMVSTFDIDMLEGMSVGIFPLENSNVTDIELALSELLGESSAVASGNASGSGDNKGGALTNTATGLGAVVKVIPIERLNSLLVVTPRVKYLETVRTWITRLDRAPDAATERKLYVYPIQNASAGHLADLLSRVYGGDGFSSTSSTQGGNGGVAPGLTQERVSGSNTTTTQGSGSSSSARKSQAPTSIELGNMSVVADEQNNALLIYANGKEYKKVESALKKLDVIPAQVLIEASILEVTLTDDLEYGVEWVFKDNLGSGNSGLGQLAVSDNPLKAIAPGFSYAISNSAGNIKAVLSALAQESLLNVISTPSVMVLDNHTASIQVGDQQPIRSGESVNSDGNVLSTRVEYKDTGVKLSVTPSVNAGGLVTMDVEQSVTDVGSADTVTGQRTFNERNITSRVAVRSGESVVLGGLIRENKSLAETGVPGLHKIPFLGGFFGKTANTGKRTELLIVLTPRVLANEQDTRDISREMRLRLRGMDLLSEPPQDHLSRSQSE